MVQLSGSRGRPCSTSSRRSIFQVQFQNVDHWPVILVIAQKTELFPARSTDLLDCQLLLLLEALVELQVLLRQIMDKVLVYIQ